MIKAVSVAFLVLGGLGLNASEFRGFGALLEEEEARQRGFEVTQPSRPVPLWVVETTERGRWCRVEVWPDSNGRARVCWQYPAYEYGVRCWRTQRAEIWTMARARMFMCPDSLTREELP